jgi:hypothetical protein
MTVRENFAIRPSKWIFGDTAPCNDLTKAAGWKSDYSCDPLHTFRANAPVPLEKIWTHPKKSFATQSANGDHRAAVVDGDDTIKKPITPLPPIHCVYSGKLQKWHRLD